MNLTTVSNNVTDFFSHRRGELSRIASELAMSETIVVCCNSLRLKPSEARRVLNVARILLANGASIAWATEKAKDEARLIAWLRDGDGPEAA